jgi:TatD DNase family protein
VIDTHCHLDVEAFDPDRDEMLARARAAGVTGVLVPAIRPRTWSALAALARQHAHMGMRCAIGIHPQVVPALTPPELGSDLAEQLARAIVDSGAVAVGECGLDGGTPDPERQELIFRAHLRAARTLALPVVIHVLRAHDVAPRIVREEGPVRGVLHSYSGGAELVPIYRDLGLAFSFAGPVSYANARKPVEAARAVPAELLLVETDAPDQAPEGHRGGRSEPAFLPAVIAGLARARDAEPAELVAITTANARRLFGTW